HGPDRQLVVLGDDGGGQGGTVHQGRHRRGTALDAVGVGGDQVDVAGQPGVDHRLAVAAAPVARRREAEALLVVHTGDHDDLLVALVEQMVYGGPHRRDVVDADTGHAGQHGADRHQGHVE